MIVSEAVFRWFVTVALCGSAAVWLAVDSARLWRAWRTDERDRDYIFGCLVGIAIMLIGLVGVLRHHLG